MSISRSGGHFGFLSNKEDHIVFEIKHYSDSFLNIDHDLSNWPPYREAGPFDKIFLQIFNRKDHILIKIREKNRV